MSVRAAIVATGTELLTGRTTDRNGPWLAARLGSLGIEVAHSTCVGDRPEDLEAALRHCGDLGIDLVVTTGGLGPTKDDLTATVVGRFAGRDMVLDPELEKTIEKILQKIATRRRLDPDAMRAGNRKQATIPAGAIAIDPVGTAPGLVLDADGMVVIIMPGPPGELHAMWPQALETGPATELLARAPDLVTSQVRLFGLPESTLAKGLREIEDDLALDDLEVTTCLTGAELVIDIRYEPEHADTDARLREALLARYAEYAVSGEGTSTEEILAGALDGLKLAVAESCTGGLLAARLTARPGASAYMAGGVVAYSDEAKTRQLDVPAGLIATYGAVSPEVAEAMADGALARFGADVAVAVTGVAGPDGGTEDKPVGYVCFCAKRAGGRTISRDPTLPGARSDVRDRSVVVGLHMLRWLLADQDPPV
ncbi:MAG: competence/damage-inducible protein A [Solirubrobacterales bacterium]